MFRIILAAAVMTFAISAVHADEVKQAACKAACTATRDKCVKEAGGSKFKEMACDQAYKKCLNDCEKEEGKK